MGVEFFSVSTICDRDDIGACGLRVRFSPLLPRASVRNMIKARGLMHATRFALA